MTQTKFPVIDLTVRELQHYFGFEEPQAIYKWQQGKCLPSVDNLYALSRLFGVSMNEILVQSQLNLTYNGQSDDCPLNISLIVKALRKAPADTQNHKASNLFRGCIRTQSSDKSRCLYSIFSVC